MWIVTLKPPRHKYELVKWAMNTYPKEKKSKFNKMKKKQLYAIWYSYHKRHKMGGYEF